MMALCFNEVSFSSNAFRPDQQKHEDSGIDGDLCQRRPNFSDQKAFSHSEQEPGNDPPAQTSHASDDGGDDAFENHAADKRIDGVSHSEKISGDPAKNPCDKKGYSNTKIDIHSHQTGCSNIGRSGSQGNADFCAL